MKIVVAGLPATGRVVEFGLGDAWAVAAATTSLDRAPERLSGSISLRRASTTGVVAVDVVAETAAGTTCDRCGEGCEMVIRVDTRMLFAPEEATDAEGNPSGEAFDGITIDTPEAITIPDRGEVELQAEDLDLGWYADGEISLDDVLGEALALEAPSRVVCADEAECDRRTDALLAVAPTDDGPFAALMGFKPSKQAPTGTRAHRADEED